MWCVYIYMYIHIYMYVCINTIKVVVPVISLLAALGFLLYGGR